MLSTNFVVLPALRLLGPVASCAIGGFTQVLLVVAIVMVLIRFIRGRRGIA